MLPVVVKCAPKFGKNAYFSGTPEALRAERIRLSDAAAALIAAGCATAGEAAGAVFNAAGASDIPFGAESPVAAAAGVADPTGMSMIAAIEKTNSPNNRMLYATARPRGG